MNHAPPSEDNESPGLAGGLSREFLLYHLVCPMSRDDRERLVVAVTGDTRQDALDDLAWAYGSEVVTEQVPTRDLERLIERLTTDAARVSLDERAGDASSFLAADVRDLVNEPPVVRYVNLLIREAYDAGASDVHFEATRDGLLARIRVDGVLTPTIAPPAALQQAVVSRIKLLAELDIAERRRPQDGRLRVRLEQRELDLRVSTVPTMHGESVVLRLLDRGGRPVALDDLGMSPWALAATSTMAKRPHGMLLVTGPTGSGKTTTLYACLQQRERDREKIVTVEEPIEYHLDGVTQVPVQRQAGVTFASALRSILRQDPDVIMIGEMRDAETAEIAIQSAMTGHLVFSTLHTNDAISAVPRLLDLGVPEYLVAATLEGVVAQRLVRRICPGCQEEYTPSRDEAAQLAIHTAERIVARRGSGCADCRGTGYRGRAGIFELLRVGENLKDAIVQRASRHDLRQKAHEQGMVTLRGDGWAKVQAGVTTIEEVLRVTEA